jgi:hypothetical protein
MTNKDVFVREILAPLSEYERLAILKEYQAGIDWSIEWSIADTLATEAFKILVEMEIADNVVDSIIGEKS